MRGIFAVLILVIVPVSAFARIGDTMGACEQRYGHPVRVSDTGSLATYRVHRLSVVVHFSGGVADMLSFRRLPVAGSPVSHAPAKPFTGDEVEELLASSADGRTWIPESTTESASVWWAEDGSLRARWDRSTHNVTIYTQEFASRVAMDPR